MAQKPVDLSYSVTREVLTLCLIGGPTPDQSIVLTTREFPCWCLKDPDLSTWVIARECCILYVAMKPTYIHYVEILPPKRHRHLGSTRVNVMKPPMLLPMGERFDLLWYKEQVMCQIAKEKHA